ASEQRHGHCEADAVEVSLRRKTTLGDVVDVERKLGAHVLVLALGVVNVWAVLRGRVGKRLTDRKIHSFRVTDGVAQVMRERANRKREIIGVLGIPKQRPDEVSG